MLQFNHIDKKAVEEMFEKDLTRNLFQFQNTIVKHLFKKKNQYNKLLNNFLPAYLKNVAKSRTLLA